MNTNKKIMFNLKPPSGSYGGGAFFVKNMSNFLKNKGYSVVYTLEPNIDLIFMIDPRKGENKINDINDVLNYKKINPNCKIIYRVNECDIKREVSINIDPLLVNTIKQVDYVVYITEWLKNYFHSQYPDIKSQDKNYVVVNGCDISTFKPIKKAFINYPIKLVTHHWSNNYYKGFHIYNALDNLLNEEKYKKIFTLTYIGRYNDKYKPKNIKLIPPCQGKKLQEILSNQDLYLTGSINEPCGMHFIEGLACGLPVLFDKRGGGIVETASKYGIGYSNIDELINGIENIKNNYKEYYNKIDYKYLSSDRCCKEFYEIINKILNSN